MNSDASGVRFIHSSDWQLGMTRAFLSEDAAARFSQARIDAIRRLGELATLHDAAFIVVAGDVFESNQLSRQTVLRTLDALEGVPVPVFLLPGNHDPLDASSIFLTPEFRHAGDHIIVIRDELPIPVPGAAGVEVVGAPWRTKHPSSDLCGQLLSGLEPSGSIRIAVAHGQVDDLSPDKSRPEIIELAAVESAIAAGKIHYLALGDRHSVTCVGDTGRVWYCGAPVATAFDEVDPNKTLLVELNESGHCEVSPLAVGDWVFISEQQVLNGPEDLQRIETLLAELPDKARTVVKMGFTGAVNLATAARLDELFDTQAELFASLKIRRRTTDLAIAPDELDQDSVALNGYARSAWDELLAAAPDDQVARDALRLFYRLSQQAEQV